ncbi:NADPH:quinone reductase-like Zn-dependent oxidoreductase [Agromyces hippuratus]|uniref:NADPH:quinone reductase-like Zn-dependent oxidoreductase n=1 Tax=Agromyces hippuratus TaxID=286438 RepID=A0A852WX61_9MICO|nr:NAD(P)-dependent alcohol dehydrogenase [Agromyces hippuratus]NYG22696.1 NADPH:quinone reductase-like Zn-dependent oxidoreductase [Agromyces hippuratus]
MRIAVYERYGPPEVLHLQEAAEPTIDASEVLVRVEASTVGPSDSAGRSGTPRFARLFFGLTKPKHPVLGSDFAGVVERVGDDVTRFAPGDRVFGTLAPSMGAHAELVVIAEDAPIAHLPAGLDAAGAVATVDGFLTALPFLRDLAGVAPGQVVLVNGASGTVGSAAVQLAKHFGATVVGVCSAANAPLVTSLGADRVIDYTREDFTEARGAYDVIFDTVGKRSFGAARRALAPHGIYLTTVPSAAIMVQWPLTRWFSHGRRAAIAFTGLRDIRLKSAELALLVELIEAGAFVPVVDRVVAFADIADAHRRVDTGRKAGSVVVEMAHAASASSPAPSPKPVAA